MNYQDAITVLGQTGLGAVVIAPDSTILFSNSTAETLLGRDTLLGFKLHDLAPELCQSPQSAQYAIRLYIVATLYVVFGLADVLMGAIRGYGYPIAPVIINLLGTCVFRIIWIGLLDTSKCGVEWIYASYPLTWFIILVALTIFWVWLRRKNQEGHYALKI